MEIEVALFPELCGGADFRQHLFHERLSAETGFDGHDQQDVELPEIRFDRADRGVRIDGEPGFPAGGANTRERLGHIGLGLEVDVDRRRHRKVAVEVAVRIGNHEMDVERPVGMPRRRLDKGRAERDVVHKMTVHHIAVDPIRPRAGHVGDLVAEPGEVTGQDGWGNDNLHRESLR